MFRIKVVVVLCKYTQNANNSQLMGRYRQTVDMELNGCCSYITPVLCKHLFTHLLVCTAHTKGPHCHKFWAAIQTLSDVQENLCVHVQQRVVHCIAQLILDFLN